MILNKTKNYLEFTSLMTLIVYLVKRDRWVRGYRGNRGGLLRQGVREDRGSGEKGGVRRENNRVRTNSLNYSFFRIVGH